MGVETPSPLAVETSLHRRDGCLGQSMTSQPGQLVGDLLLGPPPTLTDRSEIERDNGVDVNRSAPVGGLWKGLGLSHWLTSAGAGHEPRILLWVLVHNLAACCMLGAMLLVVVNNKEACHDVG